MTGNSSRMLSLLSLLQLRREWPGPVLAARLEVTPRTVRRDVERLRDLGYSIQSTKGPEGGYRLAAGSQLPPLLFDDEQAVAIALALQSAPSTGAAIQEAASRALATLRQTMPHRLRHRLDGLRFTTSASQPTADPAALEAVSHAVNQRRTLRFDYSAQANGEATRRRVEPHHLVLRSSHWYLIAWDQERQDWRIFRIDRMAMRLPHGAHFDHRPLPESDAVTFLASRMKGSAEGDRWPVQGTFVLNLPSRDVAPWIGDGHLEVLDEQSCRVTAGSWSWAGLLAWILRFDTPFTLVGPEPLLNAAAEFSGRLSDATSPPSGPDTTTIVSAEHAKESAA
ncbi:helix-turn-helix transcriptional regulator [Nesterenkonia haasae]|uniref:helix-turn-helix transcriptional regulator n=1 Tax=Nesterenkonia haasae TaxID=2587813 RepID=UPI00139127F5|nr:WYL domain-containing protein [Nesterenkonia haasae]NDK32160.1 WYL domain-containing protein [Nesterenkonia haasae]